MRFLLTSLNAPLTHDFDTVIDARSPSEFAQDHVPGAINLPVLNDAERAEVGTIYKQVSPFLARKIGAAKVLRNAASIVEGPLAHHDGAWRPLVYCWRGGQRSGSLCWMLREIGWRAQALDGGYRCYRKLVKTLLYDRQLPMSIVQLGGYTGTAKTALLSKLADRGVQVLDLEALAQHRGSLLGSTGVAQPSQKAFESALAAALAALDPQRPVVLEAESSKIGALSLPPMLWQAMKRAPWIEISAPLSDRARYLSEAYADILADSEALMAKLDPLRFYRGHATVDRWRALIASGETRQLCKALATEHYDPAYRSALRRRNPNQLARLHTPSLDEAALDKLADRILVYLQSQSVETSSRLNVG